MCCNILYFVGIALSGLHGVRWYLVLEPAVDKHYSAYRPSVQHEDSDYSRVGSALGGLCHSPDRFVVVS